MVPKKVLGMMASISSGFQNLSENFKMLGIPRFNVEFSNSDFKSLIDKMRHLIWVPLIDEQSDV